MFKLFWKTNRLIVIVITFCILLIFLIWSQLIHQLESDKKETIAAAIQRNTNLAVALEQYTIRTIQSTDAVLQLLKMEYEKSNNLSNVKTLFKNGVIDKKYINSIAILNEHGGFEISNLSPDIHFMPNLSDREHFTFHKTHTNQLYISNPIFSRTLFKTVIVISRRINKPDGSFGGTVAIQLEPASFTRFYFNADLRNDDVMSLIAPNGITYARRKGNKESFGEDIKKSPLFTHVAKNKVGNYYAKDAIFGIPSYFSYRKFDDYPVIATVGSAEQDVLSDYYNREKREYAFGTIISLMLVLFSVLIYTALTNHRKSLRKIRDNEARYRSIFENSHDAIILLSPNGFIEAINEAAFHLFKVDISASNEILFDQLFLQSQPLFNFNNKILLCENNLEKEIKFTCLDGSEFVGEIAISPFKDSSEQDHLVVNIRDISIRKEMEQKMLKDQKRFQRKLTKQIILAQERERESIGHELHDNVNQILTTVKLYLEMAQSHTENRDKLLPKAISYVMECITEIRNLSHALSAPTLGTKLLVDSIKTLVETVASSSNLKIYFTHENYHTLLIKDQKLAIYRILQEQLNNIIKHAKATEVNICIGQTETFTELWITDNGTGFDTTVQRNGIGLNNILSRAKMFGGELKIESAVGKGCTLYIKMPIIEKQSVATT